MPKFWIGEKILDNVTVTARLGAGTGSANFVDQKEKGKFVKLVGESRFDLCAVGDPIEGRIEAVEAAPQDNYSIGGVNIAPVGTCMMVKFDGLQATPGTGTINVGDYVVAGTPTAKGTELAQGDYNKVCSATIQPGTTVAAAIGDVDNHIKASMYAWRVVSLGPVGSGAVGTVGTIQRVA